MEENRKFAIIWSSVFMVYWAYCIFMSTKDPSFMMCRHIYITAFLSCAAAFVLSLFAAPHIPRLIYLIVLMTDLSLIGSGVEIAMFLAPKTIIIFVSVIAVPILFISDSLSTPIVLITNIVLFWIRGMNSGMDAETYRWTLANLIIFSSLGIIIGYFVNKARFERYYYADTALRLADIQSRYANYDQMTELQNRRAYAEKCDELAKNMHPDCHVIMADINGLKEMNDTRGHQAGDELIIGSAECLRKSFENVDSIYRIGGDEFCVILDGEGKNVDDCLRKLDENTAKWKGKYVDGISISYGYASCSEFDSFDSTVKAADSRMYECKQNYYVTSGKERRRR